MNDNPNGIGGLLFDVPATLVMCDKPVPDLNTSGTTQNFSDRCGVLRLRRFRNYTAEVQPVIFVCASMCVQDATSGWMRNPFRSGPLPESCNKLEVLNRKDFFCNVFTAPGREATFNAEPSDYLWWTAASFVPRNSLDESSRWLMLQTEKITAGYINKYLDHYRMRYIDDWELHFSDWESSFIDFHWNNCIALTGFDYDLEGSPMWKDARSRE